MRGRKIESLADEIRLNYEAVDFDHILRDYGHTRISLSSDVIKYTIGCLHGFDWRTRDYLSSTYPCRVMKKFIQSVPINVYSQTIKTLEYVLRPRWRSVPVDAPQGLSRRSINKFKDRMKELLNRDNVRILWNHLSLERQVNRLRERDYDFVQHALEAWENRELSFGNLQFILLSKLENAIPLTIEPEVLTFLSREEEFPYIETRVPHRLPTELALLKVK